jgi:hypothetical protein
LQIPGSGPAAARSASLAPTISSAESVYAGSPKFFVSNKLRSC